MAVAQLSLAPWEAPNPLLISTLIPKDHTPHSRQSNLVPLLPHLNLIPSLIPSSLLWRELSAHRGWHRSQQSMSPQGWMVPCEPKSTGSETTICKPRRSYAAREWPGTWLGSLNPTSGPQSCALPSSFLTPTLRALFVEEFCLEG